MKYLLNVTFCAGTDEPEDIDRGLYILEKDDPKPMTLTEMCEMFKAVNEKCNADEEDEESSDFPTYLDGLNIGTLMEGVEKYTGGKVTAMKSCMTLEGTIPYYAIEQWQ